VIPVLKNKIVFEDVLVWLQAEAVRGTLLATLVESLEAGVSPPAALAAAGMLFIDMARVTKSAVEDQVVPEGMFRGYVDAVMGDLSNAVGLRIVVEP